MLAVLLVTGMSPTAWGAAAKANPKYYWPNGIVPYLVDPSITDPEPILKAMREWEKAGIRFPPRRAEADYVVFTLSDAAKEREAASEDDVQEIAGAVSAVGRIGGRQQIVARGSDVPWWRYAHEIGHTLGLFHEHLRLDRDRWVTIHRDNLDPEARRSFEIKRAKTADIGSFDVKSIMLYDWNRDAVDRRKPTISWNADPSFKEFGAPVVRKVSEGDIAAVRYLYFEGGLRKLGSHWHRRPR